MAIAQQMDIPTDQLRDLGSAALVHDWSLFDLPSESRFPHHNMTDEIRARYRNHPITTVEMLNTMRHVAPKVKLFVSQVHEFLDGTGFPRRLNADQLHPLSRILGVADTYLTMTSPPKGTPRIVPCDAIAFLINGASQGQYSPKAVSALLHAVTLYPIGSIVELSDTTKARVIRANGKDYGYPIVESLVDASRVINLKDTDLFVTRPILSSEFREVRLKETQQQLDAAIARV
jgi:HD-GYP domain-containing protein (c-di-GMP phosphodiesterase class II)